MKTEDELIKLTTYNMQILKLFKDLKISSIRIDDKLYENYNDIIGLEKIGKITINKKYIKLFDDEEFILNNYINDKEMLVKNEKTNRYIKLKISHHARERMIVRYLILYLLYPDSLFKFTHNDIEPIMNNLIKNAIHLDFVSFKHYLNNFISENKDIINETIYKIFKKSTYLKNVPGIYKKRTKKYGITNFFIASPLIFIYDVSANLITTVEIFQIDIQGSNKKKIKINENADNRVYLYNLILKNKHKFQEAS